MTIYLFKSTNKNKKTTAYVNDKKPIFQIHAYHKKKTQKNESYTQNWIKKTKQQNSKKIIFELKFKFKWENKISTIDTQIKSIMYCLNKSIAFQFVW